MRWPFAAAHRGIWKPRFRLPRTYARPDSSTLLCDGLHQRESMLGQTFTGVKANSKSYH